MSITYSVQTGDTFEQIARKVYGTETKASEIARANPGVAEPLTAGTTLTVPTDPTAPVVVSVTAPAVDVDEVAVTIDGERFRFWEQIQIRRAIDAPDSIQFGAPFEPDLPGFRETFRPASFKPLAVTVGGEPLFTGALVGVDPLLGRPRVISVTGYSKPGVLGDCTPPASAYPLEFNGQGLREIAATLAAPFGVSVVFLADQGDIFERVAIEAGQKITDFLADLAKQRKLVMSSTTAGELLFWSSVANGQPVANLSQGVSPLVSVEPTFNPQEYFSSITALELVQVGTEGAQFTVKNPHAGPVVRPLTFKAPDSVGTGKTAAEAKIGRMFGNLVSYAASVSTWRDPDGNLWAPNTTLTLLAPGAMVYTEYELLIRAVDFFKNATEKTAVLELVLPGSFSGEIPETLPWD